jgi:hypothetical protein
MVAGILAVYAGIGKGTCGLEKTSGRGDRALDCAESAACLPVYGM